MNYKGINHPLAAQIGMDKGISGRVLGVASVLCKISWNIVLEEESAKL